MSADTSRGRSPFERVVLGEITVDEYVAHIKRRVAEQRKQIKDNRTRGWWRRQK